MGLHITHPPIPARPRPRQPPPSPEDLAAAAHALERQRQQLAAAAGELERAARGHEAAVRSAEDAEKAVLRERIRQAGRAGGVESKVRRGWDVAVMVS